MADNFENYNGGLDSPALNAEAVTPSDSVSLTNDSRALYIGVGGDVSVLMSGGTSVTFVGLLAGSILPIRANRVNATSTTATDIVSLY
jgi:hypothetical protein